jgi:hypothetical protein
MHGRLDRKLLGFPGANAPAARQILALRVLAYDDQIDFFLLR